MKLNLISPRAGALHALAKRIPFAALVACAIMWLAPPLHAADRRWTGNASGLWSNPNNWNPVGTPQNGEDLIFDTNQNEDMVNDLTGLSVRSLTLREHDYVLSGNTLTVRERIDVPTVDNENSVVIIHCRIRLGADISIKVAHGDGASIRNPNELHLRGSIDLNGHNLQLDATAAGILGSDEILFAKIFVSGKISGIGNVTASPRAKGSIVFDGSEGNTFTGTLRAISLSDDSDPARIRFNKSAGVVVNNRLEVFGRVVLDRDNQIGDQATVALGAIANFGPDARDRSFLNFQGHSDTFTHLVFTNRNLIADAAFLDTAGGTLTLLGDIATDTADVTPILKGVIDLPAGNHTFDVRGSRFYGIDVQAQFTGAGGFTKTGNAALRLRTNNTFAGSVAVNEGNVEARHALAFGTAAGGVTLSGNGSLTLDNVRINGETLFVRGTRSVTANTDGSFLHGVGNLPGWMGRIELDTNLVVLSDDLCVLGGPVVGPGGFEFLGQQNVLFGSDLSSASTYTGTVRVLCDLLTVFGHRAFRGPLIVGGGFGSLCEVRWGTSTLGHLVPEVTVHPNGLVNLDGRDETFTRLIMHGGRVITGTGFVSVARIITNPTNVTASIEGNLVLASTPTTEFTVADGPATPDLAISALITDGINNAGIVKTGDGELRLSGANTYDGTTRIDAGVVHIQNNASLGTPGAGTTVGDGATLQIEFVAALAEPLNIRGTGRADVGAVLDLLAATGVQAGIVLAGPSTVRVDTQFAILSGVISGTGPFTKVGAGALQFGGGSGLPNTYSGNTLVRAGVLVLSKGAGVTTVPGHLVIGGGGVLSEVPAVVRHAASFTIGGSVTVERGGLWDLNGLSESFDVALLQGGPALTLNRGGDVQTGPGTLTLPPGDVPVSPGVGSPSPSSSISGHLALQPGTHRFIVQGDIFDPGSRTPELTVSAAVGEQPLGAANLVKEGGGTMRLSGDNNFSGAMTVNDGELIASHALALGTAAGGTLVNGNASLTLEGGIQIAGETLTLDSANADALLSLGPVTNTWGGAIVLQRTAGIRVPDTRGAFTHFGGVGTFDSTAISGPGGFTKTGPGAMFITGLTGGNNYTGPTTVTEGVLEAIRTGRNLSGTIVVTGANAVLRTGRPGSIFTGARTVLPVGASMAVQDGGLWAMNGTNFETISRLVGDGNLTVSTAGALTISNDVSCEFSGSLSGSGALNKRGLDSFHVTGNSPGYTGLATVFEGTYKVDGNLLNGPVTVKVSSVLRGTGVVGDVIVENGGVVRVDSDGPGRLGGELVMNSANFQNGSVLSLAFYGPHPTGGNDHLLVDDAVTLTSPTLSSGFNYPAREGDVITLINLNAAGAVNGTMSGFPQGGLRMIGDIPVVASYVGGNGNDVTLTVTNLPLRGGGAQVLSGNGGTTLVPNDCSLLRLVVTNRGALTVSNLHGTLRSLTAGVLVTMAESAFPNLAPNASGTNLQPFQIRTEPTFPCGGSAQFELVLTGSNLPAMAVLYTIAGPAGHALAFNGSGNYVAVPHTAALNAFPFTATMWVKTSQSEAGLLTKYVTGSSNGWSVFLRNGRVRAWYFRDNLNHVWGGGDGLDGGFVADGQWHHVAFTVKHNPLVIGDSGGRLFVDGVQKDFRAWSAGRNPQPGPPTTTQEVRLGKESGAGIPFAGQLDEISIWGAALSVSQIQTNMSRALIGNEASLMAYYRCDEGSGSTVADSAPNVGNNNGTWVGAPLFVLSSVGPFSVPGGADCNSGGGACESCIVVTGQFTPNALQSVRRLTSTGLPSLCDPPKQCPGFDEFPGAPVLHILHHFTNSTASEPCVTAQLYFECPEPANALGVAAYLGEFRINQPCSNFLGDDGAQSGGFAQFSFRVPPRTNIVLVVTARDTNLFCNTYMLELFSLPCPPPSLQLTARPGSGPTLIQWSSAYPEFHLQSANSLDGPGSDPFSDVLTPPTLSDGKYVHSDAVAAPRQFFRLEAR